MRPPGGATAMERFDDEEEEEGDGAHAMEEQRTGLRGLWIG